MIMATEQSIDADIEFAITVAKTAGDHTLKWFRNANLEVDNKSNDTPVTEADRKTEELVRSLIGEKFPDDTIVGEEFPIKQGSSGRIWTIDPIHGTVAFISGVPSYSTLLALGARNKSGECEWNLGIIYVPILNELVYAYRNRGCWYVDSNGKKTQSQLRDTEKIADSYIVATTPKYVPPKIMKDANVFHTWGGGYGYLLLVTGQVDAMMEIGLSVWDFAPFQLIVEEAGGEFFEWNQGAERKAKLYKIGCTDRVSTNGKLELDKHLKLEQAPIFMYPNVSLSVEAPVI